MGLQRLGLITLPPLNTFTAITNAAMEAEVVAGNVPAIVGTVWAQKFFLDLIGQYNGAGAPDDFIATFCGDAAHAGWCTAAGVAAAAAVGS